LGEINVHAVSLLFSASRLAQAHNLDIKCLVTYGNQFLQVSKA